VRLEFDVVDAYAEVGSEETLSLVPRDSVAGWSMRPAYVAGADAGHMNGPEAARSPSLGDPGRVDLEKGSICRYLVVAPVFSDANLRDQGSDRPADHGRD